MQSKGSVGCWSNPLNCFNERRQSNLSCNMLYYTNANWQLQYQLLKPILQIMQIWGARKTRGAHINIWCKMYIYIYIYTVYIHAYKVMSSNVCKTKCKCNIGFQWISMINLQKCFFSKPNKGAEWNSSSTNSGMKLLWQVQQKWRLPLLYPAHAWICSTCYLSCMGDPFTNLFPGC